MLDDRGLAVGAHPGQIGIIAQVDMPVHEPLGLVLLQQVVEAGKALVGPVIAIVQAGRRGMGQQQVDAAARWALNQSRRIRRRISCSVYWKVSSRL